MFCRSGWGSRCYIMVHRRGKMLRCSASEACGKITWGGGWHFCWRHWFWQIRSGELGRLGVVYVDRAFQSTIFVDHLVFVGDAAGSIGSFPSRCQLGGTFGRGGEGED